MGTILSKFVSMTEIPLTKSRQPWKLYCRWQKADIPANIGFEDGGCQRTMYTLTDDGTIYAEWEEEYPI